MNQPSPKAFRTTTPTQLIKKVIGLRNDPGWGRRVENDSTLMDMDAPTFIPAGSSQKLCPDDPLLTHYTAETLIPRCYWGVR